MSTTIRMHLEFLSEDGDTKSFSESVSHVRSSSDEGKDNLAKEMFAELRRAVSFSEHGSSLPKAGGLLQPQSGRRRVDPMAFIDMYNIPQTWMEISNTFTDIRYVISQAKAYKDLEPTDAILSSNPLLVYLHFEKMYRLNLAVFQIVKIQDLVIRLLHESFSGRLIHVEYDKAGWERSLKWEKAEQGLKRLVKRKELTAGDHRRILNALELPFTSPNRETIVLYRNRLAHGIRPSVDYPELYSHMQDRAGRAIKDSNGNIKGRMHSISGGRIKPEFLFNDLYTAFCDYMGRTAEMLKALKAIPRLS